MGPAQLQQFAVSAVRGREGPMATHGGERDGETADAGSDSATAVSDDYTPKESVFNGKVQWVEIDLGDSARDENHLISACRSNLSKATSSSTSAIRSLTGAPLKTQAGKFTLSGDGLCIGRDSGDAVSEDYKTPGTFAGGTIFFVGVTVEENNTSSSSSSRLLHSRSTSACTAPASTHVGPAPCPVAWAVPGDDSP
jgi:hypothetical protein